MSEPEKKPAKVEPTMSETPVIKDSKPEPVVSNIPAPPAVNSNEAKKEPVVGVSPVIEINAKKEPVVVPAPVVVPPVAEVTPPANTNAPEVKAPEAKAPEAKAPEAVAPVAPVTPVAEAPAVEAPAATTPGVEAPAAHSRKKKWLMRAFNVAAGAGVTMAAKSAAVVGMTVAGAPVWATMAGAAVAVGVAMTLFCHFGERHTAKKGGAELSAFFSKAHAKEIFTKKHANVFLKSSAFALIGSALAMGFQEGIFQEGWNKVFGGGTPTPAPVVVPPVETVVTQPVIPPVETVTQAQPMVLPPVEVAPVVAHCATAGEQFATLIDGQQVSARVTEAIARSASTNAAVAAQGTKDLAYFAFNGFDGVPKNPNVALELFKQAAESGNMQAKVDLVYMQYHGLGGVAADKTAALSTMKSLGGARAASFVANWGGSGAKAVAATAFDSSSILKGLALGCPKP